MHLRYIKIIVAIIASAMALIYALQNIANINAAHGALVYVLSGAEHEIYPETLFFKSASTMLAWVALIIVLIGEFSAGLLLLKGALDMYKNANNSSEDFNASKKLAEIGAGIGIIVWFGLFGVIGAAFFQMWQTQVGTGSMNGAFQYFISMAFTLLFVSKKD